MIRWFGKWLRRLVVVGVVAVIALAVPVVYVETACRSDVVASNYKPILPPEHHRAEGRMLMTYPEWHIVHAYDDYAEVIGTGDPHDYGFFRGITQFWSSLCALSQASGAHGGFGGEIKQTIYVIGVSFSAELALKAAYEETIGRIFAWARGPDHSPLDAVSARQARDYAQFLQQVPWYKWDFRRGIAELEAARTDNLRDRERRTALGGEFAAKAAYADVIAQAVAAVGFDALTLRMIVTGTAAAELVGMNGVTVIGPRPEGLEIETVRYRALTHLFAKMAGKNVDFIEIAGNDDIMLTLISPEPRRDDALASLPRQGYGDTRHLVSLKVTDLGGYLRSLADGPARLEHVHDY